MNPPVYRQLRGYSLDPGFSTRLDTAGINEITYQVQWEDVTKGPCGQYFEVIDVDPASDCFYDPVNLNDVNLLAQNGLAPSEGNPKFHQQFVYTIAMKTLEHFEASLGRKIIWAPYHRGSKSGDGPRKYDPNRREEEYVYVPQLRLYPHAFRKANAYYSREKKAVLFGYFEAAAKVQGTNFPGGVIFSCLSPDIVAHELTHAILDSIHPRFIENTNPDVAAFHEAFADIVALLQRFTITPLVEHQIARTRGNLSEYSVLGELATQFGNALQQSRGALRGAIGEIDPKTGKWKRLMPDPTRIQTQYECHDRGAILVATFFDAFIRLYNARTEDLLRIASNGTGILQPGAIHPDLVKRLAETACTIASHLLHICIRALDYCPPVDINYGDFLRAVITADLDTSPRDANGYRLALIEAFRSWGIFPDRVNTLSPESLQWTKPTGLTDAEKKVWRSIADRLKPDIRDIVDYSLRPGDNREEIYHKSNVLQAKLHGMLQAKAEGTTDGVWTSFLGKLGLTNQPVQFEYEGKKISKPSAPKLEVHKVRPVYRVGREGKIIEQILITLTQTLYLHAPELDNPVFRGGCTLILNMSGNYDVEYIIYKNVRSEHRFTDQMNFQLGKTAVPTSFTESMYEQDGGNTKLNFAHLHFHSL